jgi:hypothetical protein
MDGADRFMLYGVLFLFVLMLVATVLAFVAG